MKRSIFLLPVVLILSLITPAPAAEMTIRWHGHSFFEITSSTGKTTIAIDPHQLEAYRPVPIKADIVLVSHPHEDHNDMRSIKNADTTTRIDGIKVVDRRSTTWDLLKEKKIKEATITTIPLYHDNQEGKKRGKVAGFVIEMDGYRIAHLGDIGHTLAGSQLKALGRVDVLMIPVGGIYTVNGAEAKRIVSQIRPRFAIFPMHYATEVYDFVLTPDEFLEDQKNVKKLMGNKYEMVVGAKAPQEPVILMLDWKSK